MTTLRRSRPLRTIASLAVAVAVAGVASPRTAAVGSATRSLAPSAVRAAAACTGWTSDTIPPTTIRVLRTNGPDAGTVAVVPFRDYVKVVMAAEWGPGNPTEALRAGAVAVKEYGWYRAIVWRGRSADDGSCYDVADSSVDQVYAPETRTPSVTLTAAVDATWGIAVRRAGGLFVTHYEGGAKDVACAADADGRRLFQNSAMRCARDGMTAPAILGAYYYPDVEVVGAGPVDPAPSPAAPDPPTLSLKSEASVIAWGGSVRLTAHLAPPAAEGAGGRSVHLQRSADGVGWTQVADLTTDAKGSASRSERPATNGYYRLAFDGATDLAPATSPVVRVVVRRVALVKPGSGGSTRRAARGARVVVTALIRPARASVGTGPVEFQLLHLAGRSWVVDRSWTVAPDAAGRAHLRVTLASRGTWTVRAMALRTSTNANSTWSTSARYVVP